MLNYLFIIYHLIQLRDQRKKKLWTFLLVIISVGPTDLYWWSSFLNPFLF